MTAVESEFQALGFGPEPGRALLEHLCDSAVFWDVDGTGFDDAGLFTDPSGAAVAIGYGKEGTYMNATVAYVPRRRVPARVWRLTDTLAQVDVIDPGQAGENQVVARFLAYLDDAPWFPRYRLSAVGRPRQARVTASSGPGAGRGQDEGVVLGITRAGQGPVTGAGMVVAHSSWGPGRAGGVIPTISRPGRRRGTR